MRMLVFGAIATCCPGTALHRGERPRQREGRGTLDDSARDTQLLVNGQVAF